MQKPFSESCVQNRDAIFEVLKEVFSGATSVLEIGSGTGQHAVSIGGALRHLEWQTSDVSVNHLGIQMWLDDAGLSNVLAPLALAVDEDRWPTRGYDAVFSANTAHIMSWSQVQACFSGVGRVLMPGGVFALYGPFYDENQVTAESNLRFDAWLKSRNPQSGVRDFEAVDDLARDSGMSLQGDFQMPANNRMLVWCKESSA